MADPAEAVRLAALEAVGDMGSDARSALEAVLRSLSDGSAAERIAATEAAANLAGPDVFEPLLATLKGDDDPSVRAAALEALGQAVREAVDDSDPETKAQGLRALATFCA